MKELACILCVGLCLSLTAWSEREPAQVAAHAEAQPVRLPITLLAVTDGDTIRCDVHLPWGVTLSNRPVRLLGYDAPETSRKRVSVDVTDAEIERGKAAAKALAGLVTGSRCWLDYDPRQQYDPHGRLLGALVVQHNGDTVKVAEWMRARGWVR